MGENATRKRCADAASAGHGTQVAALEDNLAGLYRALGHPARLAILRSLSDSPGACCGDIVGRLPLAQSTVSQHLQVLKDAGLVTCQIRGRSCHYQIDKAALDTTIAASAAFLQAVRAGAEARDMSCCDGAPLDGCGGWPEPLMETSRD